MKDRTFDRFVPLRGLGAGRESIACLIICFATVTSSSAEEPDFDWPQWRGPERNGVSNETGLLDRWPAGGPELVWKATGAGLGYSSLAISNGRVFTMGNRHGSEYVMAFDTAEGRQIWAS